MYIQLTQVHYPYSIAPPTKVSITLNGKSLKTVTLPRLKKTVKLNVPAGSQKVAIRIVEPSQDHWLYVGAKVKLKGQWTSLIKHKAKSYHVATHQQPIELYLDQPKWLRIDEFSRGKVTHRYQYQASAGGLTIKPKRQQKQAMLRILSLQNNKDKIELWPFQYNHAATSIQTQTSEPAYLSRLTKQDKTATDAKLISSASSSDSVYMQYQSRRDFDSDASSSLKENFIEGGWRHRQKTDCLGCYWRSDLFARQHASHNITVLGTHQWLQGAWSQSAWRWQLKQSLFIQSNDQSPFKWFGAATLGHSHGINERLRHAQKLQIFARHISADAPSFLTDNDIYSTYQTQHLWGVSLEESVTGRPWLDSFWRIHGRLMSNELENSLDAEYVQAGISWHQYFKPVEFSANYRHRSYLIDDDRDLMVHKPSIGFNLHFWQGVNSTNLLQYTLRLNNDLERNDYAISLELSWDFNGHRTLKDYSPRESVFHRLRQRDISQELALSLIHI